MRADTVCDISVAKADLFAFAQHPLRQILYGITPEPFGKVHNVFELIDKELVNLRNLMQLFHRIATLERL